MISEFDYICSRLTGKFVFKMVYFDLLYQLKMGKFNDLKDFNQIRKVIRNDLVNSASKFFFKEVNSVTKFRVGEKLEEEIERESCGLLRIFRNFFFYRCYKFINS